MKKSDFDLSFQIKSTESKIVASLERIAEAFRVLLWREGKEHGLTPIQIQVLVFLHFHKPALGKVSYLASEFNLTKATISSTVSTLEQKGLIVRETEPSDSRSFVIRLTAKGKSIAAQTSLFTGEIFEPLSKMSKENREALLVSLLQVIRHLHESGVIAIQRMCFACRFYDSVKGKNKHYCSLLEQELSPVDLRIDCPEFEAL